MKQFARRALVGTLWGLMGRRNLARFARMLTLEVRLDAGNEIATNGERIVQRIALEQAPADAEVVIIDVGANVGDWSRSLLDIAIATHREDLRLFSFEPSSATFERLRRDLLGHALSRCATPIPEALSDHVGRSSLNIDGDFAGTNSLHALAGNAPSFQETISLNTLDDFCRERQIERVSLVKIDAEGHDMYVIDGATGLLQRRAIDLMQFEYNQRWIMSRRYLLDAFDRLQPLGYRIGKVTRAGIEFYRGWHFELETWREGNYLACREDWCDRFPQVAWWNET